MAGALERYWSLWAVSRPLNAPGSRTDGTGAGQAPDRLSQPPARSCSAFSITSCGDATPVQIENEAAA